MATQTADTQFLIKHVTKHISLTREEIAFFASLLKSKSLKPGEFLLREGEVCKYESFVVNGYLKSYYEDEHGVERVIDFFVEEWWADDLYSFLTQTGAKSSIVVIEECQLLQMSKNDLELLYGKVPKFEKFFRLLFQNAYIAQRDQINLALFNTAEERYRLFLKKKPYAEKRFAQKDIASYLGLTPQFFSAMKKKMSLQRGS